MYISVICSRCSGSGEGMYDGSICGTCAGRGGIKERCCSKCEKLMHEERYAVDDICYECYENLFECEDCNAN